MECLAILKAVQKCHFYLAGLSNFKIITDHRPLTGLFQKDLPDVTNPRLQRFREGLSAYQFTLHWTSGKFHLIADALSRAPVFPAEPDDSGTNTAILQAEDPLL